MSLSCAIACDQKVPPTDDQLADDPVAYPGRVVVKNMLITRTAVMNSFFIYINLPAGFAHMDCLQRAEEIRMSNLVIGLQSFFNW
jgi:hypothetical protein